MMWLRSKLMQHEPPMSLSLSPSPAIVTTIVAHGNWWRMRPIGCSAATLFTVGNELVLFYCRVCGLCRHGRSCRPLMTMAPVPRYGTVATRSYVYPPMLHISSSHLHHRHQTPSTAIRPPPPPPTAAPLLLCTGADAHWIVVCMSRRAAEPDRINACDDFFPRESSSHASGGCACHYSPHSVSCRR